MESGGPIITVFRARRGLLTFYLLFGGFLAVQGVASGIYFLTGADMEMPFRAVSVGLAAFIVFLGYWFGNYAWRRLRDPDHPIVVAPAGLHDRALSRRPIPWSDIRDLHVWDGKGGPVVVFDLDDAAAKRAGILPRVAMSTAVNRPFGYGYRVHGMGTDASVDRLIEAMAPYATVRRDG